MDKHWKNGILVTVCFCIVLCIFVKCLGFEDTESGRMFWWFFLIPVYFVWLAMPFVAYLKSKDAIAKIESILNQKENQ